MRSSDYLNLLTFFHQWISYSLMVQAYSKLTIPGFIELKLKDVIFTDGHQRGLNRIENVWDVLEETIHLSYHQYKKLMHIWMKLMLRHCLSLLMDVDRRHS